MSNVIKILETLELLEFGNKRLLGCIRYRNQTIGLLTYDPRARIEIMNGIDRFLDGGCGDLEAQSVAWNKPIDLVIPAFSNFDGRVAVCVTEKGKVCVVRVDDSVDAYATILPECVFL